MHDMRGRSDRGEIGGEWSDLQGVMSDITRPPDVDLTKGSLLHIEKVLNDESSGETYNPYYFEDGENAVRVVSPEKRLLQKRFEVFMVNDTSDRVLSDACRTLEAMVFREKFDKDGKSDHREIMPELYGAVESNSHFIGVIDKKTGLLAGCMRVVDGERSSDFATAVDSLSEELELNEDAIKTDEGEDKLTQHIQQYHEHYKPENTWEIGTLAIAKGYRGKGVGFAKTIGVRVGSMLYHSLFDATKRSWSSKGGGVTSWIAMFKEEPYNMIRRYGVPMEPFCDQQKREYYGAENTQPAYTYTKEILEKMGPKHTITKLALGYGLGVAAVISKDRLDLPDAYV